MTHPDLADLLAYLDFLVAGPKQTSLDAKESEEHIRKVLVQLAHYFGNDYTTDQIKAQLYEEFRKGELYAEYNLKLLFLHGSSELRLTPEMRRRVDEKLTWVHVGTSRGPRQSRIDPTNPVASHPAIFSKTRKARRKHVAKTQDDRIRKARDLLSFLRYLLTRKQTRSRGACFSRTSVTKTVSPLDIERHETPSSSSRSAIIGGNTATIDLITPRGAFLNATSSTCKVEATNDGAIHPIRGEAAVHHLDSSMTPDCCLTLVAELSYYKQRCETAEAECESLKLVRRHLVGKKCDDLSEVLLQKERQLSSSRKKLSAKFDLEQYPTIGNVGTVASNAHRFAAHFQDLKEQMPTILVIDGSRTCHIGSLYEKSDDLCALLSTVFPTNPSRGIVEILGSHATLTLYELTQALTGAAMHLWIFGGEFRLRSLTITPLLQMYRSHIANSC
jgi:hypothetical protein